MNLLNIIKLSKQLQKFSETITDNGIIIVDGQLEVGKEAFIEVDGEVVPVPNGEYVSEDKVITIENGVIAEIKDKETEPEEPTEPETPATEPEVKEENEEPAEETPEEPAEETPEVDEKDAKIAELEARISELEHENAELKASLNKAEEELSKPVKTETKMETQKPALKNYFRK